MKVANLLSALNETNAIPFVRIDALMTQASYYYPHYHIIYYLSFERNVKNGENPEKNAIRDNGN